jgi:outer membrane protein assembly factor BamB
MTGNDDSQSNTNRVEDRQQTIEATGDRSTERRDQSETSNPEAEATITASAPTRRRYLSAMTAVVAGAAVGGGRVTGETSRHTQRSTVWGQPGESPVTAEFEPTVSGQFDAAGTAAGQDTLAAPETLGELWRQEFQDQTVGVPFFAGNQSNRVYAVGSSLTQQTIYGLNKNTGEIAWETTLNSGVTPPLGIEPGRALYYVDTTSNALIAADSDDGSEIWREALGQQRLFAAPFHLDADSTLYLLRGSNVIAYDDQDGTEQWRQSVTGNIVPLLNGVYDDGDTSLMHVASSQVTTQTTDGVLTAIDRDSGDVEWSDTRENPFSFQITLGDTAYGMFQDEFVAYDAASGDVQWTDEREDNLIWSFIYFQSESPLYALAAFNPEQGPTSGAVVKFDTSGQRVWEHDPGAFPLGITVQGNEVHVATRDGRVIEIIDDPDDPNYGAEAWSQNLDAGVRDAGLRRSGDVLYTGTVAEPGTVYALSAADGSTLDTFQMDSGVAGGLSVVNERIWIAERPPSDQPIGAGDSVLYELGSDDGGDPWYAPYTNENGVVETAGLQTAIGDLRAGQLSVNRLKILMDSWESGQPVSP